MIVQTTHKSEFLLGFVSFFLSSFRIRSSPPSFYTHHHHQRFWHTKRDTTPHKTHAAVVVPSNNLLSVNVRTICIYILNRPDSPAASKKRGAREESAARTLAPSECKYYIIEGVFIIISKPLQLSTRSTHTQRTES